MESKSVPGLTAPVAQQSFPAPAFIDKARRAVWKAVQATLYRAVPTRLFGPRRALLRLFGATIAGDALPYPGAKVWAPWNLAMEGNACIGDRVICYNVAPVRIGRDAIVSQGAHLCTPSHDFRQPGFALTAAPIEIGPNAWVAADAFVGPGVVVGRDAVVGARAVVLKSVPPGLVVAGNPARVVGERASYGEAAA